MSLRWQELVVLPDGAEDVACDDCGAAARQVEGRIEHREAPLARYTVRWVPGAPGHAARHVLYLGDWLRRDAARERAVALVDFRGGPAHGFYLRDDAPDVLRALSPWRPRFVRRADAIGQPLGADVFAMLDALHVKDDRLSELRGWGPGAAPLAPAGGRG